MTNQQILKEIFSLIIPVWMAGLMVFYSIEKIERFREGEG